MRIASVLAFALLAAPAVAETDLEAFRRLRAEAVAAIQAEDWTTAEARLAEADARNPAHPGLMMLSARAAAARGDTAEAIRRLDRYARAGLSADVQDDPVLERVVVEAEFQPVARRLASNASATGAIATVGRLEGAFIAEGVAWDAERGRLFVSGVHGRTIVQVDRAGRLSRWLDADPEAWGVFGIAIDPRADVLWAAESGSEHGKLVPVEDQGRAGLIKVDLAAGRALARYPAPADRKRGFGDVAVGPDGTVWVSDSVAGEVWRLRPGAEAIEQVVSEGVLGSPQGLAVAADGSTVFVLDYSSGLHRIEVATSTVSRVSVPADLALAGSDGLVLHERALYVVQNGVNPQRILRLELDASGLGVRAWSVLAANLPDLSEPTGAVVEGGDLLFIARSQWTDFDPDGSLRRDPPGDAVIARVKLP